jgi:hypothetical protein
MAVLSADKTYVTVQKGDTLSGIASKYLGSASKYKQLASINGISNPDYIYIGQKIYLSKKTSSSSSTTKKKSSSNKAKITHFGLQSNAENVLFAVWTWDHTKNYKAKSNTKHTTTENYSYQWYYTTGDGVWFVGTKSTTEDKQCTWSIPSNAKRIRFRVRPISKKYTKNKKETSYFTAEWTSYKEFNVNEIPPDDPSTPTVTIEKYKLTAELDNIDSNAKKIEFQIVKNDSKVFKTGTASIKTNHASYSCTVDAGGEYKVRCRAIRDKLKSDWSSYSSNATTIPSAPGSIIKIKALSETEVQLDWENVKNANNYTIEYTTKKMYFDSSNNVSSMTVDATVAGHAEVSGLTSGEEYFFRVKATNNQGDSDWCPIKSIIIGKVPAAPTTWSSTTTAIVGEDLNLYWVHNSEDGSVQTSAEIEVTINGKDTEVYLLTDNSIDSPDVRYVPLTEEEKEEGKTNTFTIKSSYSGFAAGCKVEWRVRTKGIISTGGPSNNGYSEWSTLRVVDAYAPPTLELNLTNQNGEEIDTLESFPLCISATAGPNTQNPIGYHINIIANETYETIDNLGNEQLISVGDSVYSKYFDINTDLLLALTAGSVNLDNDIEYTVIGTVSMDSGLTAESSVKFTVSWTESEYVIDAEIAIDENAATAHIRPYCEIGETTQYVVIRSSGIYTQTTEVIEDYIYGTEVKGAVTDTGEQVFSGTTTDGEDIYYCEVENISIVPGVTLSVYRREYDGTFVELATGLDNENYTTITDPHPSLDYARYRIVAIENSTGAVSFYDVPGVPVGEKAAIIQWDEDWSSFDTTDEAELEQPAWSGSMIKIPYNIDVSDSNDKDVELVEYVGRSHAVAYYGTQLGVKSNWSMEVPKTDKETLYALRRLQIWMGNVYVREPSGSGYWATISVSYSQAHRAVTIPVTLSITRVEGGI